MICNPVCFCFLFKPLSKGICVLGWIDDIVTWGQTCDPGCAGVICMLVWPWENSIGGWDWCDGLFKKVTMKTAKKPYILYPLRWN